MNQETIAYKFWARLDAANSKPLNVLCKDIGINYNTVRSNRSSNRLPSLLDAYRISTSIGIPLETLIEGEPEITKLESLDDHVLVAYSASEDCIKKAVCKLLDIPYKEQEVLPSKV